MRSVRECAVRDEVEGGYLGGGEELLQIECCTNGHPPALHTWCSCTMHGVEEMTKDDP